MLLMVLPAVLYFLIFNYLPCPASSWPSSGSTTPRAFSQVPGRGLKISVFFFGSGDAWFLTRNTILYNVAFLIVGTALQVLVGRHAVGDAAEAVQKVTQTMMFLPYFISMVVIGAFMYNIFNYEFGAFNTILTSLGMERVNVYSDPGCGLDPDRPQHLEGPGLRHCAVPGRHHEGSTRKSMRPRISTGPTPSRKSGSSPFLACCPPSSP